MSSYSFILPSPLGLTAGSPDLPFFSHCISKLISRFVLKSSVNNILLLFLPLNLGSWFSPFPEID
jgi:hypothetical protein